MPKSLVSLFFALAASLASAQEAVPGRNEGLDYKLSVGGRTRPLGAAVYAESGYGYPLWGNWQDKEKFLYGYVRPWVRGATSVTVSAVEGAVSIYPVAPLGFTFGKAVNWRMNDNSREVDCWKVECGGRLDADFYTLDLVLGAGSTFYAFKNDRRDYVATSVLEPWYEESTGVVGAPASDRLVSTSHTLGRKFGAFDLSEVKFEDFVMAVRISRTLAETSGNSSDQIALIGSHRHGPYRLAYVAGLYKSSIYAPAPTFALLLEWNGRSGLGI